MGTRSKGSKWDGSFRVPRERTKDHPEWERVPKTLIVTTRKKKRRYRKVK